MHDMLKGSIGLVSACLLLTTACSDNETPTPANQGGGVGVGGAGATSGTSGASGTGMGGSGGAMGGTAGAAAGMGGSAGASAGDGGMAGAAGAAGSMGGAMCVSPIPGGMGGMGGMAGMAGDAGMSGAAGSAGDAGMSGAGGSAGDAGAAGAGAAGAGAGGAGGDTQAAPAGAGGAAGAGAGAGGGAGAGAGGMAGDGGMSGAGGGTGVTPMVISTFDEPGGLITEIGDWQVGGEPVPDSFVRRNATEGYSCPGSIELYVPFTEYATQTDVQINFNPEQDWTGYTTLHARVKILDPGTGNLNHINGVQFAVNSDNYMNYDGMFHPGSMFADFGWHPVSLDLTMGDPPPTLESMIQVQVQIQTPMMAPDGGPAEPVPTTMLVDDIWIE